MKFGNFVQISHWVKHQCQRSFSGLFFRIEVKEVNLSIKLSKSPINQGYFCVSTSFNYFST